MERFTLLVDDHHGQYIPQVFAQKYDMPNWHVSEENAAILLEGPEHEWYWEAWEEVLQDAYFCNSNGRKYTLDLAESGNVFADMEMTYKEALDWYCDYELPNHIPVESFKAYVMNIGQMWDFTHEDEYDAPLAEFEKAYAGQYGTRAEYAIEWLRDSGNCPEDLLDCVDGAKVWNKFASSEVYALDLPNGCVAVFYNI